MKHVYNIKHNGRAHILQTQWYIASLEMVHLLNEYMCIWLENN